MILPTQESMSQKTGVIKGEYITFSSSRSTTYDELADKLAFFDNCNYSSFIFVASSDDKRDYTLFVVDAELLKVSSLPWELSYYKKKPNLGKVNGWSAHTEDIEAKIVNSMSGQLWMTFHKRLATVEVPIDIN